MTTPLSFVESMPEDSVLSLDVFDTAITRRVAAPAHIFAIVQKRLIEKYGERRGRLFFRNFISERVRAEKESRSQRGFQRDDITLDEIYKMLVKNNPHYLTYLEEMQNMEVEVEVEECIHVAEIKEAFVLAQKRNIPIVFTSDMYLPLATIEKMLKRCGYTGFQKIFLSSDRLKTKHTGNLWDIVLDETGKTLGVYHIGDNLQSDVTQAMAHGVFALHFDKISSRTKHYEGFSDGIIPLSRLQADLTLKKENPNKSAEDLFAEIAKTHLPILYGSFIKWINERVRMDKVEVLYFLSRDGHILKRVWEAMSKQGFVSEMVKVKYAKISRRSLWVPSIDEVDNSVLTFLTGGLSRGISVRLFLERVGIDIDNAISEKVKVYFVSADESVIEPCQYEKLKKLFMDLKEEIRAIAKAESEEAIFYFSEIGMLADDCKKALVDLGWHASMQAKLLKILTDSGGPQRKNIEGFYVGLFREALRRNFSSGFAQGMICSPFTSDEIQHELHSTVQLLEIFHMAPHGSVVKYQKNNTDGDCVVYADNPKESLIYQEIIGPMQTQAIDALLKGLETGALSWDSFSPEAYYDTLRDICVFPSAAEADALGSLRHWNAIEHIGEGVKIIPESFPDDRKSIEAILKLPEIWTAGTLSEIIRQKILPPAQLHEIVNTTLRLSKEAKQYLHGVINCEQ